MNKHARKLIRRARSWAGGLLAVALFASAAVNSASAQTEEGIKAAFVYNFAKFTKWPTNAFTSDTTPITVGFVGADSLADVFEKIVSGKSIAGRDFTIKRFAGAAGVENCHMVFASDTQAAAVISATTGKPILTIGDSESFSSAGGMINLVKNGAKIRFDIDFTTVQPSQLKLDSRLCQLARNIKGR